MCFITSAPVQANRWSSCQFSCCVTETIGWHAAFGPFSHFSHVLCLDLQITPRLLTASEEQTRLRERRSGLRGSGLFSGSGKVEPNYQLKITWVIPSNTGSSLSPSTSSSDTLEKQSLFALSCNISQPAEHLVLIFFFLKMTELFVHLVENIRIIILYEKSSMKIKGSDILHCLLSMRVGKKKCNLTFVSVYMEYQWVSKSINEATTM